MKKRALFILAIAVFSGACSDDTIEEDQFLELTQQEKNDLLFFREEEKLARDVYLFSFDMYKDKIFSNIASSEQQHMDQVLVLLNNYGLTDPASSERGVFENKVLQELYNELTAKSALSLLHALNVGAVIEDLDINDISLFEKQTEKTDILEVYDLLKCGSENHLRSYTDRLINLGEDYVPTYISFEEFTSIISSDRDRCGQ